MLEPVSIDKKHTPFAELPIMAFLSMKWVHFEKYFYVLS